MKPIKENKYQEALKRLTNCISIVGCNEHCALTLDKVNCQTKKDYDTLQELINNYSKLEQDYKELKDAFNDCLKDTNKEDRYEIALFMVIRNSQVLPSLIDKTPLEDIDDVSYKTMLKCLDDNYLDWSKCEMIFNGAKDRHNKGLN